MKKISNSKTVTKTASQELSTYQFELACMLYNNDSGLSEISLKINKILNKKAVKETDYAKVAVILNLPSTLPVGSFGNQARFKIDYVIKVRLVRYLIDGAKIGFLATGKVLKVAPSTVKKLYSGKTSKVAIALDEYFVVRSTKLANLRKELDDILGFKFNKKTFESLSDTQKTSVKFIFFSRLKTSDARMLKILSLTKADTQRLDFLKQ